SMFRWDGGPQTTDLTLWCSPGPTARQRSAAMVTSSMPTIRVPSAGSSAGRLLNVRSSCPNAAALIPLAAARRLGPHVRQEDLTLCVELGCPLDAHRKVVVVEKSCEHALHVPLEDRSPPFGLGVCFRAARRLRREEGVVDPDEAAYDHRIEIPELEA